jgi:hypothetical protein
MTDVKALRTLWLACGSATFYYSANAWLASTGADFHLPGIEFPKFEKAMVYGTFVAPLAYFVLWLSIAYARLRRSEARALRSVPILESGMDIGPGLVARWVAFLGFTLIPVAAQIHFVLQILQGAVFARGVKAAAVRGPLEMLSLRLPLCKNCWRFGDPEGLEFFPFFQPWLLVLLLLLLAHLAWLLVVPSGAGSLTTAGRRGRARRPISRFQRTALCDATESLSR